MSNKLYPIYCALVILGFMSANHRGLTASSLYQAQHRTVQGQNHYHK